MISSGNDSVGLSEILLPFPNRTRYLQIGYRESGCLLLGFDPARLSCPDLLQTLGSAPGNGEMAVG